MTVGFWHSLLYFFHVQVIMIYLTIQIVGKVQKDLAWKKKE